MNVNERIARALGWTQCSAGEWHKPGAEGIAYCASGLSTHHLPDYAHSLDACLPVLAALREKGLHFDLSEYIDPLASQRMFKAYLLGYGYRIRYSAMAPSPATALAECIAQALEANEQNH